MFYVFSAHHFYAIVGPQDIVLNLRNLSTNIGSKGNLSDTESDTVATINEIFDRTFPLALGSIKVKTDQGKFEILIILYNQKTTGFFYFST